MLVKVLPSPLFFLRKDDLCGNVAIHSPWIQIFDLMSDNISNDICMGGALDLEEFRVVRRTSWIRFSNSVPNFGIHPVVVSIHFPANFETPTNLDVKRDYGGLEEIASKLKGVFGRKIRQGRSLPRIVNPKMVTRTLLFHWLVSLKSQNWSLLMEKERLIVWEPHRERENASELQTREHRVIQLEKKRLLGYSLHDNRTLITTACRTLL